VSDVSGDAPDDFFDRAIGSHTFKILCLSFVGYLAIAVLLGTVGEGLHPAVIALVALAVVSSLYTYYYESVLGGE